MNKIPHSINALEVSASRAKEGADEVGPVIQLQLNDAAKVAADVHNVYGRPADPAATPPVVAIEGKQSLYLRAQVMHTAARISRKLALADGQSFVVQAMNSLKGDLGTRWNAKWRELGFTTGSLRLPRNPLPVLTLLSAHYRTHTDHEVTARNLTAGKAEQLKAAIVSAQTAADAAHDAEKAAKQTRDLAVEKLRTRLGDLRDELGMLLSDDDSRWYRFGFRRPIDGSTPDLVQKVALRLAAPGEVVAEWTRARLAETYRVSWKVTGATGVDPTVVGIFTDPLTVLTGLPHGANITVIVTARNAAGESAPMEAQIAVP